MMLKSATTGTTWLRRKLAPANSSRCSSTVRVFPPVKTSIGRSTILLQDGRLSSGTMGSTNSSTPSVVKDVMRLLVVPVNNRIFHEVCSAPGRHFMQEVTGLQGGARRELAAEEAALFCAFNHVRLVG